MLKINLPVASSTSWMMPTHSTRDEMILPRSSLEGGQGIAVRLSILVAEFARIRKLSTLGFVGALPEFLRIRLQICPNLTAMGQRGVKSVGYKNKILNIAMLRNLYDNKCLYKQMSPLHPPKPDKPEIPNFKSQIPKFLPKEQGFESLDTKPSQGGNNFDKYVSGILIILILTCFANATFAQEKKKPKKPQAPPTKIVLPSDSTKADTTKSPKKRIAKETDERLHLPDVLIYGSDTEKRVAGKKITISPDQPELVNPPSLYDPLQGEEIEKGAKQDVLRPDAKSKFRQAELTGYGGAYGQFGGGGKWWQALTDFDYGIEASVTHLGGQFENSQKDDLTLGARLGFSSTSSSQWRLFAQYASSDFGLYGSILPGHTREFVNTAAKLTGQIELGAGVQSVIEAEFEKGDLRDEADSSVPALLDVDNTYSMLSGELGKIFSNSELKVKAKTLRDRIKTVENDSAATNWHAVNLLFDFAVNSRISAAVSADFTATQVDGGQTKTKLRPGIRFIFAPSPKLIATVSYGSGFEYLPWKNALSTNRYLANTARPLPEDMKWKVGVNIDWQVTKGFIFKAKYENKHIDGFNYFTRDSFGTFRLNTGDFKLGLASIGGRLTFSDGMKMEFSLNVFDDAYQLGDGNFNSIFDIPYRGEFRAPLKIEFAPVENLLLETNIAWIGTRRTTLLPMTLPDDQTTRFEELPAYVYANFHANYRFSEHFEAFAQVNNIFDDTFDTWQGYREMGLNGLAGVRYNW